jgi:hypothetical protein
MNISENTPRLASPEEDMLLRLEISIAKRADSLCEKSGYRKGMDLIHWLQAEAEAIECVEWPQLALAAGR